LTPCSDDYAAFRDHAVDVAVPRQTALAYSAFVSLHDGAGADRARGTDGAGGSTWTNTTVARVLERANAVR
jgi:hypothetical protein